MDKSKCVCISVDGLPYVGKSTVCNYLKKYDNNAHLIVDDGIVRCATMSRCICMNNAEFDYSVYKDFVVVYLLAAKEDWDARCLSPEVASRYDALNNEMNKTALMLDDAGVKVLAYNTSKYTPYMIAKDILKVIKQIDADLSTANSLELSAATTSQLQ